MAVSSVSDSFFDDSADTVFRILIHGSQVVNFPFDALVNYENLGTFEISQGSLRELQPITSESLFEINLSENRIAELVPGNQDVLGQKVIFLFLE